MVRKLGFEPRTPDLSDRCSNQAELFPHLALDVGLGPTTCRLTAECSTNWANQANYLKIFLSTKKKIQPPIKLDNIVFQKVEKCKQFKHIYNIGVDNCHLNRYNKNFFMLSNSFVFHLVDLGRVALPS